jgi:hypothetical protein
MTTQEAPPSKKAKTTIYMSEEDERMLNEIFIKRLRKKKKTDRSALLCEGIRLLYQIEVANDESEEPESK